MKLRSKLLCFFLVALQTVICAYGQHNSKSGKEKELIGTWRGNSDVTMTLSSDGSFVCPALQAGLADVFDVASDSMELVWYVREDLPVIPKIQMTSGLAFGDVLYIALRNPKDRDVSVALCSFLYTKDRSGRYVLCPYQMVNDDGDFESYEWDEMQEGRFYKAVSK